MQKLMIPAVIAMLCSACSVGPDYKQPQTHIAPLSVLQSHPYDRSRFETSWWQQFEDPTLNQLVLESMRNNQDLRAAFAHLQSARALRDSQSHDQLPMVNARVSSELEKAQQPPSVTYPERVDEYDSGLDISWEPDLFGRIQRQLSINNAQADIAEDDVHQLQVSLIAELVDTYGNLRSVQQRKKIASDNVKNQSETRDLTEKLRQAGVGSELDVIRADARLAATQATIPQLEADETRAQNRIRTLLGKTPEQMTIDLVPRPLPVVAKQLKIGDPTELLRRRPDIQIAERQLAQATDRVGIATADLFPRVSLTGFLGFISTRGSDLGSADSYAWGATPTVSWAALDWGKARARIRSMNAEKDAAFASYHQQVLVALEDTSNAFSDYRQSQQVLISRIKQAEASKKATLQARLRYQEGTMDFLQLLDAEREQFSAEDAEAQAEVQIYHGIVEIYKALGGGIGPQQG